MLRILIAVVLMMGTVVSGARADSDKDKSEEKPVETIEDLPRDARMALFEAQQHLEKGETDKAVEGLGKYVQSHDKKDDSFLVRYQYATMLVQADRRDEAMKQYQRVVELEPRYDEGWLGLGETAYGLGDYTRAANALKQGYDLSTEKRPELLYYAAAARLQSGDAAGALPWLEELASGDHPKFEWYRGLVSACLQADDKDRGQHAVDAMLDRFPNNADAWYLAFQFYASTTNYPKAAGSLTVVGYLRPLTRTEHLQLGDLYSAIDNPAAAADQYAIATRDSASTNEVERVASAYMASYQPDRALVVLNKTLTEEPSFKLWSLLGDLQVVEKRFHEAYKAFSVCVGLSPDEPRPHLMLGYCALELNQPDLAMTHLSVAAGSEEYAERAQMLIQRAQIMRSTPSSEADQSSSAAPPSLSGN
ncbi:MAG TPA: tetratricopeptide repeat protein [Candidatus Krumholzibacteria bacterium]|nr:tetratricopeptide repeat protein [Candidatus Krumholzibacteria bacterium]